MRSESYSQYVIQYYLLLCRIYYQYDPFHTMICSVTIHALLHIADSIEQLGPIWAYWTFPMKHYCEDLQQNIQS